MNAKYFRNLGWAQLSGRWTPAALFTLVYIAISIAAGSLTGPFVCLVSLLLLPMSYSYSVAFLDDKRSASEFKIEQLFDGYKDFLRIMGTMLLTEVYIVLWTLLLIVPGVIKAISYSQTQFILKDYPELSYNEAIERSMAMMEGHKMQYFFMALSFIGWILLAIISCGILSLWVNPYISATNAHFYEYVKGEYEKRITA